MKSLAFNCEVHYEFRGSLLENYGMESNGSVVWREYYRLPEPEHTKKLLGEYLAQHKLCPALKDIGVVPTHEEYMAVSCVGVPEIEEAAASLNRQLVESGKERDLAEATRLHGELSDVHVGGRYTPGWKPRSEIIIVKVLVAK